MQARVRNDCKFGVITAFGGREYVRREWRAVPPGFDDEARKHVMLETLEAQEMPIEAAPQEQPTKVERRKGRRK